MRLVLLGDPVEHSGSPQIHNAALTAAGIEGSYEARRVDGAGMRSAVDEVRYGSLDGANVTMPHKELAFALADRTSEAAMRAGAVNTLVHASGMAVGENTDVTGLRRIRDELGLDPSTPLFILGSGGAAAAALVAFDGHPIRLSARSGDAASGLLQRTRVDADVVEWGSGWSDAVVVNATPIGMLGESLPDAVLEGAVGLIDLPYGPDPTPSVVEMRDRKLPVIEGLDALIAQAAASFQVWTGVEASLDAMGAAVGR